MKPPSLPATSMSLRVCSATCSAVPACSSDSGMLPWMQATVPMVSLARAMSVWSNIPDAGALGGLHDLLEPGVVAAFGEQQRDHALLHEAFDDLQEARPVEGVELLLAHEAVGALVQRHEADGHFRRVGLLERPVDGHLGRAGRPPPATLSGWRNMSTMTPLVPRRVSPRMSNGALVAQPANGGKPAAMTSPMAGNTTLPQLVDGFGGGGQLLEARRPSRRYPSPSPARTRTAARCSPRTRTTRRSPRRRPRCAAGTCG